MIAGLALSGRNTDPISDAASLINKTIEAHARIHSSAFPGCRLMIGAAIIRMPMPKPKVVVVMPAYNAQHTIEKTWREVVAHDVVDLVIVVDDASQDDTMKLAQGLEKVVAHRHPKNLGYGGNQKTCYQLALDHGADIVVMVHPDYQYTPKLIPAMVGMIASGLYSCVLASRILGGGALSGGMPMWRYVPNRFLTLAGNILLGTKVSEFHTGYRAFSRQLL